MTYQMRVQEIGTNKVNVVEATGKISTIQTLLGNMGLIVINYWEACPEGVKIVKPNIKEQQLCSR